MNAKLKTGIFWVAVLCVAVVVWQLVKTGHTRPDKRITFTEFIADVKAGKVSQVSISDGVEVEGTYKDNSGGLHTWIPASYVEIYNMLQDQGVNVEIRVGGRSWIAVLAKAAPFLVLLAFWLFLMRQMQNRGGSSGTTG